MTTFLFTWNPLKWRDEDHWMATTVSATRRGQHVESTWSTGSRTHGFELGDRVFLLKQGVEPRGIVGSGWISTDEGVFEGPHYAPGRERDLARYVWVEWDVMLPEDDPLPLEDLRVAVPGMNWVPQASGQSVDDPDAEVIERLWAEHTHRYGSRTPRFVTAPARASHGAQWQSDPVRRKRVEDYAQAWLEKIYRDQKWEVEDTRYGNPFDAVARKGNRTLYLEAKGTETDGASVEVTIGEVNHARSHPGECVLGILGGIRFLSGGEVDPASGEMAIHELWDPDEGHLKPTRFRWSPP